MVEYITVRKRFQDAGGPFRREVWRTSFQASTNCALRQYVHRDLLLPTNTKGARRQEATALRNPQCSASRTQGAGQTSTLGDQICRSEHVAALAALLRSDIVPSTIKPPEHLRKLADGP